MLLDLQSTFNLVNASINVESTRMIPENMSPDCFSGGFNISGLCRALDGPRVDSASLMHPSINRQTRYTPSSCSELMILGRLVDLDMPRIFRGFGKLRIFRTRVCLRLR